MNSEGKYTLTKDSSSSSCKRPPPAIFTHNSSSSRSSAKSSTSKVRLRGCDRCDRCARAWRLPSLLLRLLAPFSSALPSIRSLRSLRDERALPLLLGKLSALLRRSLLKALVSPGSRLAELRGKGVRGCEDARAESREQEKNVRCEEYGIWYMARRSVHIVSYTSIAILCTYEFSAGSRSEPSIFNMC
jgi:hypothetical protein